MAFVAAGVWMLARLAAPQASLFLSGGLLLVLAALIVGIAGRARLSSRDSRRAPAEAPWTFRLVQVAGGLLAAALSFAAAHVVFTVTEAAAPAVLRFAIYPWEPARLVRLLGLLLTVAAALWVAAAVLGLSIATWRVARRDWRSALITIGLWLVPAALLTAVAATFDWRASPISIAAGTAAAAIAAFYAPRAGVRFRHAPQAARLLTLFLALLVPALLLYPSAYVAADRATRRLIETRFVPQALAHPQELQARLDLTRRQIDAIPALDDLIESAATVQPAPDAAFRIWSQTALAEARITSAIELYDPAGVLVSRFALNFPEYAPVSQTYGPPRPGCNWEVFGEAAPFGSEERRMLHAERGICRDGAVSGTIVVHVMLDYRALPFISSQSPYFEVFRTEAGGAADTREIDLVIYGWGLLPIYASESAWPIDDALFHRIYAARDGFWWTLDNAERRSHVYIANDRAGIFLVGYPAFSPFDHVIHLAELATLAALVYVGGIILAAIYARVTRKSAPGGRALLREIRASFTRKLFLAFVAASVLPVITLAIVIRQYFASELRSDVEEAAARTAATAQRVIEESLALQRRGSETTVPLTDDAMVRISQVIDQDVNIFLGARLLATSERDLFASGLLSTRTPEAIYRAIVLEHQSGFVGQDTIGDFSYTIAATPVRAGVPDAILTVPIAPRQQQIERGDLRARSRRSAGSSGLHPARRRHRVVDGGAHRRSGQAADSRYPPHRARRFRRPHCGAFGGRVPQARRRVQRHGGGAEGAARSPRANPPSRGVGRDGQAGGARDQEPAYAHPAVRRPPAARPRGPAASPCRPCWRNAWTPSSARSACCGRLRRSSRASRRRRRRGPRSSLPPARARGRSAVCHRTGSRSPSTSTCRRPCRRYT